jgi:hypothetical protein
VIVAALVLSLAAVQQGSIDDDWALVNSCARLSSFRSRWGERNRYSGFYAQVSRRLRCSAPAREGDRTGRDPVRRRDEGPATRRPATPARPSRLETVVLDASGGGDAATLAAALDRVADGGTIVVRPGSYSSSAVISRAVVLRGIPDSGGALPILESRAPDGAALQI